MLLVCIGIGCLGICSVYDIRTKEIPWKIVALCGAGAILYRALTGQLLDRSMLAGVCVSTAFTLLVRHVPVQIGEGDGLMLEILALCSGFFACLESFAVGVLLAAAVSVVLLVMRRASKDTTLPFVPFLFAGYLLWLLAGVSIT